MLRMGTSICQYPHLGGSMGPMSSAGGFITVANGCILKIDALRRPIENIAVCDHIIANFKTRSGELSHGATIVGERGTSARYRVERSHCTHRDLEKSSEWALSGRPVQSGRRRSRRPGRARG